MVKEDKDRMAVPSSDLVGGRKGVVSDGVPGSWRFDFALLS